MKEAIKYHEACPHHDNDCPVFSELKRLKNQCKRLQKLTLIDALTGLYNFRYLLSTLEDEMERTRRTAIPTSLVMIDLDHFKKINDSFGHESGNKILQWMGKFFRQHTRTIDRVCRYGGEEFVIILPGTRLAVAGQVAERLRSGLSRSSLKMNDKSLRLTASFGVDTFRGRRSMNAREFISRADGFLLKAKSNGRNCVCHQDIGTTAASTQITRDERDALFIVSKVKTG